MFVFFLWLFKYSPYDTYRIKNDEPGLGQTVQVFDCPILIGEILRVTVGAKTETEEKLEDFIWLYSDPERQKQYQLNKHGWLELKR